LQWWQWLWPESGALIRSSQGWAFPNVLKMNKFRDDA